MEGIKEAFNTKTEFEEMGYMLPGRKPLTRFGRTVLTKRSDPSATQAPPERREAAAAVVLGDATAPAELDSATWDPQWQQHFYERIHSEGQ